MLQVGQMNDFINELASIIHEERIHEMRWECWLHKIHGMDFDKYVKECEGQMTKHPEEADMKKIESIVRNSNSILESFNMN